MNMLYTVEVHELAVEGPLLDGAKIVSIEGHCVCEDGKTVQVMAQMRDGRLVAFQFCPGLPPTAHVVAQVR